MVSVVKINEQLAEKIRSKENELKDKQKTITTLCLDTGDGKTKHGRVQLKAGGVEALSFSSETFGGRNISYDDLLTLNLQGKVSVIGTSKATSFLRLAFNKNMEEPGLGAKELFDSIRAEFDIQPPPVDEPENKFSMRR